MRWKVERAGTKGAYEPGWFARNEYTDEAGWFPTWRKAMKYAHKRSKQAQRRALLSPALQKWGMAL